MGTLYLTSHILIHYNVYTDIWLGRSIQQQVSLRNEAVGSPTLPEISPKKKLIDTVGYTLFGAAHDIPHAQVHSPSRMVQR